MYCYRCGSPVEEGDRFCLKCGAPISPEGSEPEAPLYTPQVPYAPAQPPYTPQAYAPPTQPPYTPPPYGGYAPAQPSPKKGMSKKAKGLMWGGIGLAVLLAIAAVLIFVVLPGAVAGPLSGDTTQTRFVNEGARLFAGAFSDFSTGKVKDITSNPFDMDMSVTIDEADVDMDLSMAYDNKTLGILVDAGYFKAKMLLLEDTLYAETDGTVAGIRFDTDVDLSKEMTLKERLDALAQNDSDVDYKALIEAFLNSISEDCFNKSGSSFTLEMTASDLQDALDEFSKKLDDDKSLKSEMEKLLKSMGAGDKDIDDVLSEAQSALDYTDFNLTFEITYEGGKPTGLDISYKDADSSGDISFGYEQTGKGKKLVLDVDADDDSSDVTIDMLVSKSANGLSLNGSIEPSEGEALQYEGNLAWKGDTLTGEFKFGGDEKGEMGSLKFEQTLKLGLPDEDVKDDKRFAMDTSDAQVMDLSEMMGGTLPLSANTAISAPFATAAAPAESFSPAAAGSYSIGLVVPATDGYYEAAVAEYQSQASLYGVDLTTQSFDYDTSKEVLIAQTLVAQGVDALIVESTYDETAAQIQTMAESAGIPVVFVGTGPVDGLNYSVLFDSVAVGEMAALQCGSGDICLVDSMDIEFSKAISTEFVNTLASDSKVVATDYANYNSDTGKTVTEQMLSAHPGSDVFVCLDPGAAPGVLEVLSGAGYKGQVVCYVDDSNYQELSQSNSGLNAVYIFFDDIEAADAAFTKAMSLANGESVENTTTLSPYWN